MSDELIKSLNQRIAELERDKAGLQVAVRDERKARKEAKAELESLTNQSGEALTVTKKNVEQLTAELLKAKEALAAAPSEKDARINRLELDLRTRDHRDAWKDAVGKDLHEKASVEKLWREIEYTPGEALPTLDQLNELVGKAKEAAPYLFATPDTSGHEVASKGVSQREPKTPLKVDDSLSRGARDTTSVGKVTITKSVMQDPGWMTKNKPLADAWMAGNATVVED